MSSDHHVIHAGLVCASRALLVDDLRSANLGLIEELLSATYLIYSRMLRCFISTAHLSLLAAFSGPISAAAKSRFHLVLYVDHISNDDDHQLISSSSLAQTNRRGLSAAMPNERRNLSVENSPAASWSSTLNFSASSATPLGTPSKVDRKLDSPAVTFQTKPPGLCDTETIHDIIAEAQRRRSPYIPNPQDNALHMITNFFENSQSVSDEDISPLEAAQTVLHLVRAAQFLDPDIPLEVHVRTAIEVYTDGRTGRAGAEVSEVSQHKKRTRDPDTILGIPAKLSKINAARQLLHQMRSSAGKAVPPSTVKRVWSSIISHAITNFTLEEVLTQLSNQGYVLHSAAGLQFLV
jgi:hypothetical protein